MAALLKYRSLSAAPSKLNNPGNCIFKLHTNLATRSLQAEKVTVILPQPNDNHISTESTISRSRYLRNHGFGFNNIKSYLILRPHYSPWRQFIVRNYSTDKTTAINVPSMGDSITDGKIMIWFKKPGDRVEMDEPLCTIETDKIDVQIRAPEAGVVVELLANEGSVVKVGQSVCKFQPSGSEKKQSQSPKEAPTKAAPAKPATPANEPRTSPAAATSPPPPPPPPPSTPKATHQGSTVTSQKEAVPVVTKEIPKWSQSGEASRAVRREPMSRMRQRIGERLKESQNTNCMLTTFNEVDMQAITDLRAKFKDDFEKVHGVKLGFMSAFVKASTAALLEFPIVNAVIDNSDIVYRDFIDISVAVATPTGLVVPVLRNCERMSFSDIEKTINEYGMKARKREIALEDMAGGTFTISNGGVYGSMMGTPIINPPQSAILGMHAVNKRPIVINDEIKIRPMMYVALTYDHRLIDGKDAVSFLKKIKTCIEDPRVLLLDL